MLSLNRFLRIRFMQINSEQSEFALKSLFPFVGKALLSDVCLISSTRVQKAVCLIWVGSPGPQSSLFLNGLPLCHQEWPLAAPAPGQDRFSSTIILCLITMHPSSLFCLGNSGFYSTPVILTENAMAPHSGTLAWKIPWMEEPGRLRSMGLLRVGHDWATSLSHTGEGNGNPLQCSCLENPRDGGAWWAAIYGVARSRTRLKWPSSSSSDSQPEVIFALKGHLAVFGWFGFSSSLLLLLFSPFLKPNRDQAISLFCQGKILKTACISHSTNFPSFCEKSVSFLLGVNTSPICCFFSVFSMLYWVVYLNPQWLDSLKCSRCCSFIQSRNVYWVSAMCQALLFALSIHSEQNKDPAFKELLF